VASRREATLAFQAESLVSRRSAQIMAHVLNRITSRVAPPRLALEVCHQFRSIETPGIGQGLVIELLNVVIMASLAS